jgi:hypothetical protein
MAHFFNQIDSLNNNTLFYYIILVSIFIFILKKLDLNIDTILILAYGSIFFYMLVNNKFQKNNDDLGITEKKLTNLPIETQYLFRDKNLIDFLDFISDLAIFDSKSYNNLISTIDSILILEQDIETGTQYCKYDVENAIELKSKALNILHSISHSVPAQKILLEKIKWSQNELDRILTKHLNFMIKKCKSLSDSKATNVHSFKPDLISNIKSFDPNFNNKYDYLF